MLKCLSKAIDAGSFQWKELMWHTLEQVGSHHWRCADVPCVDEFGIDSYSIICKLQAPKLFTMKMLNCTCMLNFTIVVVSFDKAIIDCIRFCVIRISALQQHAKC